MSQFTDVMVDLETTGVDPAFSNILQIAAVKFNANTREISHDFFDRCLLPKPRRYWDEDTRAWWGKRKSTLDGIMARMEAPELVLQAFRDWVGYDGIVTFWGKPTHFDFSFIQATYKDMGQPPPFHYRYANDLNSFARGRYFPEEPPQWEKILPFEGEEHNALHDCLHQLRVVFKVLDRAVQP